MPTWPRPSYTPVLGLEDSKQAQAGSKSSTLDPPSGPDIDRVSNRLYFESVVRVAQQVRGDGWVGERTLEEGKRLGVLEKRLGD